MKHKPTIELHPARALRIIEGLVMERCDEDPLLGTIYKLCHQANSVDCSENHPMWTDEAIELEKQLVEDKTIPAWPLTDPAVTAYTRNVKVKLSQVTRKVVEPLGGPKIYYVMGSDFGVSPHALPTGIWDIGTEKDLGGDHFNLVRELRPGVYLYESGNGNTIEVQV